MTVLVSDSFNRANSTTTLGSTDSYSGGTAKAWQVASTDAATAVFGISTNQAYRPTSNIDKDDFAFVDAGVSDNISIQLDFVTYVIDHSRLLYRFVDKDNFFIVDTNTVWICVAGTYTQCATLSASIGSGKTVKVTLQGTLHTIYINGVQVGSFTNSNFQTSTKHGFNTWPNGASTVRWDNFIIEDLNAGTTGSTAFNLKQSLYLSSSLKYDLKQALYQTLSQAFDSRQSVYQNSALTFDSKQTIYNASSAQYDTKQTVFNVSTTQYDTRQGIYEVANALYDTLQQIADGGINGSTRFDTRMVLYAGNQALFDTKQVVYQPGVSAYDLKQAIYQTSQTQGDMKLVLFANAPVKFDTVQRMYNDGTIDFDTLQQFLEDWSEYREVIRIPLTISSKQAVTLVITQREQLTLNITQRQRINFEL